MAALLGNPGASAAQAPDTLDIGILVDQVIPDFPSLMGQLVDEITAVVGTDAVVRYSAADLRENGFDLDRARSQYQELIDDEVDLVLAIGPVTSQAISELGTYPTPTIVFGALNLDRVAIDATSESSGIDNFTYVVTSQSYDRDLATFASLYDFERIGIILLEPHLAVPEIRSELDRQLSALTADYELIGYTAFDALLPTLDRVDAVYLAESFGIQPDDLERLAQELIDRGIPSFSGVRRQDVEMGFLATSAPAESLDQFFRRIALHVEAVANGQNLADRPVLMDFNETLTINFNTAELVGVPLKYSLIATTEFVGDFVNSLSEQTYTLQDLVAEALGANLLLDVDRRNVDLSDQEVRRAWSTYLPSVQLIGSGSAIDPDLAELSGGQNPQYSALGTLEVSQVLFSPAANANIGIQQSLREAQREDLRAAELDLILDAANAYFNALILKANLQIQKQNLDVTNRNLVIAQQNNEAGQSGRGDVLRLQSAAARDMQSLIEAINELQRAHYAINQLLNRPINREIDVADDWAGGELVAGSAYDQLLGWMDDPSIRVLLEDFLVEEAHRNAPELRSLDYNVQAAERNMALNGSQWYLPTLAAVGQWNRTFDQGGAGAPGPEVPTLDANYTLGLQVSIPLFDSDLRRIGRQTAEIQADQLRLNRRYTVEAIDKNVRDVVLELSNQISNIELSRVSATSAAEALDLTQAAYSEGAVSIVDLLDAQTSLLQANLAQASANYTFLSTALALGRIVGDYFILSADVEREEFSRRFEEYRATRTPQE